MTRREGGGAGGGGAGLDRASPAPGRNANNEGGTAVDYRYVSFEVDGGVARMTLNRPEVGNALHIDRDGIPLSATDIQM